jgi:hypothetical protein
MSEMHNESQPIRFVVNPDFSLQRLPGSGMTVPTVGNTQVYHMTGDFDRPMVTNTNTARLVQAHPVRPGYLGLASGVNPAQIESATQVRDGLASRCLKTELYTHEMPSYIYGDVSVDPRIVQNGGQFDIPTSIGRDLLTYRTSFNSGGHIIWPLGPRDGIPTRVMNRNIVNLCQ